MISVAQAILSLYPDAKFVTVGGVISKWQNPDITQPTEAEIQAEITRLEGEQPWKELRQERNRLLAETDYLALSDNTMSAEMTTYRQALRDITSNTSDPANPTWPTKPES